MNLLEYSKAYGYALPQEKKEIKRILEELQQKASSNLGRAMTMDNVLYYRDCSPGNVVFFQMIGRPRLVSVDNEPLPEPKPDATTYYYDNILWVPNNDERKAYIKAFEEYLTSEETLSKICRKNGIFCCQCIYEEIVPIDVGD